MRRDKKRQILFVVEEDKAEHDLILAGMLESDKGSIDRIDYHGVAEHTAGDADWLRTALITDFFLLFDFDPQASEYSQPTSYRHEDYARGIARSAIKASRLASREKLGTRYDHELYGNLAEFCDEVDLARLLESQEKQFEESQTVAVVCTALFFLSIWPSELNRAWAHCKSLGRT